VVIESVIDIPIIKRERSYKHLKNEVLRRNDHAPLDFLGDYSFFSFNSWLFYFFVNFRGRE
jgi:hypothetical protein